MSGPLTLGSSFQLDGEDFVLSRFIDVYSVLAVRRSDGDRRRVPIAHIIDAATQQAEKERGDAEGEGLVPNPREALSEYRRERLDQLLEVFLPFLYAERTTRADAEAIAKELGTSVATVYRKKKRILETGDQTELLRPTPTGGRGKSRVDEQVEKIIMDEIESQIISVHRVSVARAMRDIRVRCKRAGLKPPHVNTVYRRVKAFTPREIAKRQKRSNDERALMPFPGRYVEATHPNSVWQIDHTPLDLCIVDDVHRRNIGRPWLTMVIDVFSRTVPGFYLSLDPPNEVSVGMCLVHAILPKHGWLAAHGLSLPWPNYGMPVTIHADNDGTFRSAMITEACTSHGMRMEWRAVGKANWGGHIERMLGTFNKEIHSVPGTTFSSPDERKEYKSHLEATFTFAEIESYLAELLCGSYHHDMHSGIGRPPISKYEAGLLGDGESVGVGLPAPVRDPERLRLDFLERDMRTVQQYGVMWDKINYYDPVLDRWIRAMDPKSPKQKMKFVVRRDKRDISHIYFLDPELNRYFKIPYRNITLPSLTMWEIREVRRHLREQGEAEVDEDLIFRTYESLRARKEAAKANTTKVRREAQRRKVSERRRAAEKAQIDALKGPETPAPPMSTAEVDLMGWSDDDAAPVFEEVSVADFK